jgi:hypothetical protein
MIFIIITIITTIITITTITSYQLFLQSDFFCLLIAVVESYCCS